MLEIVAQCKSLSVLMICSSWAAAKTQSFLRRSNVHFQTCGAALERLPRLAAVTPNCRNITPQDGVRAIDVR